MSRLNIARNYVVKSNNFIYDLLSIIVLRISAQPENQTSMI
jgi:hypothetical protein